jgi:hypothetical protein
MTEELKQIHYDDVMADLASLIMQYGARKVLYDFKQRYPDYYRSVELSFEKKQIARLFEQSFTK